MIKNIILSSIKNNNMNRRRMLQTGRGLGGIFKTMFRVFKPLATSVAKSAVPTIKKVARSKAVRKTLKDVGKEIKRGAITSAADAISDLSEGHNPTKKLTQNVKNISKNALKKTAANIQKQALPMSTKPKVYVRKGRKKYKRKTIYE